MSEFNKLLEEYATVCEYIDGKEDEIAGIKKVRDKIKVALMATMNNENIANAKSQAGHAVCLVKNNSAKVEDGEAFYNFVLSTGDTSFLTKHVDSDAVDTYLKEHNELPPGIIMTSAMSLRFTKAKK